MKKFKYRLEALLKMCEHIEKEKQKELAVSEHKVIRQKDQLYSIDHKKSNTLQGEDNKKQGSFTVVDLLMYTRFIQKLKKDTVLGNEMLKVLENEAGEKRDALLEASRERKKYETLKDKQQGAYYDDINKTLDKENDEIALTVYRQKNKS